MKNKFLIILLLTTLFSCSKKSYVSLYFPNKKAITCNYTLYKNSSDNIYIEIDEPQVNNKELILDSIQLYINGEKNDVCKIKEMKLNKFCDFVFVVDTLKGEIIHKKCDNKILFLISSGLNYKKRFDINSLNSIPACYLK